MATVRSNILLNSCRRRILPVVAVSVLLALFGGSAAGQGESAIGEIADPSAAVSPDPGEASRETPVESQPVVRHRVTLIVYSILIVLASWLGGLLPSVVALTHTRMQTMISFVGGLMLGIGFLHLMPHASHELGNASTTANWMMVGIVLMFVLLRLFHFHNHEPIPGASVARDDTCQHDHDHDHQPHQPAATGESHSPAECHTHGHAHGISWAGIAFGLSIHTLIDGLALAASTQSSASGVFGLAGLGTFLAVMLHKPLDAVSITSLMAVGGHSRKAMSAVNFAFALMCPLGAILFVLGVQQFSGIERELLGTALAFSAGVFVCISLSDLLPEMEFHSHNKVQLTTALAVGIALSWGLTFLESGHLH